ncbi:MAG: hypothetical protein N2442_14895 [Spirochaetes bacterium]|nr:hypothetical protein [Spirochaetota bacterium]
MMVTLYRKDNQGHAFYYTIHDRQGSLFAPFTLTVMWGRRLDRSREKIFTFATHQEMNRKVRWILDKKIRDGYRVLYSYFRSEDAADLKAKIELYQATNS